MSRKFKIEREPYEEGVRLYKKRAFTFETGVTVLVGCNGSGKTTLLRQIKSQLEKDKIPCLHFDNYANGGNNMMQNALYNGNVSLVATSACSSEGERIMCFCSDMARQIGNYVGKHPECKELWILIDAIDSGWSIDNICDAKEYLFKPIIDINKEERDVYILVSANEYEMCRGYDCFDVINARYRKFKTYDSYRKFVLKSREDKIALSDTVSCD